MRVPCKNIPTFNVQTNQWTTTSFNDQLEFGQFILDNCFKEPGDYDFPDSVHMWNNCANTFIKEKCYTRILKNSADYYRFWDSELLKCRLGVIWIDNDQKFYLTKDYYFTINYGMMINKEKGQEDGFLSVRDVQYHMMLYIKLAEIFHKYAAILKRRQMAYSVCLVGKTANIIYFENKKTLKWFASKDNYLDNVNGSWKILEGMINHLNKNTPWSKVFNPGVYPNLQQKIKFKTKSGWATKGNQSTLVAKSLSNDPKLGVGGSCFMAWYEEGGIAPTADMTLQYMKPALESGNEKAGIFIIGGSVGDLDECVPLENMMKEPEAYEMFWVNTTWFDKSRIPKKTGLFIPAQYGMPQAVDKNGNSLVSKAMQLLDDAEDNARKLSVEEYTLAKSQQPRYMTDAFATRKVSKYPLDRINSRQDYIESNKPYYRKVILFENDEGKIEFKNIDREELKYPIDKKALDKRGVVLIHELPMEGFDKNRMYLAGVDNIEVDITVTSDSVFSIYILKVPMKVLELDENGKSVIKFNGGNIVASYTGRYSSVDETNQIAEYLVRMYNAFTLCERNKPNFINHMKKKGYSHLLARESDIPLFKDMLDADPNRNDNYGIQITSSKGPSAKKAVAENSLLYWLNTELDVKYVEDKNTGEKVAVKTIRRLDTIDDKWLLEEFKNEDRNTDRKDAFRLATLLYSVYENEGIIISVNTIKKKKADKITKTVNIKSFINTINSNLNKNRLNFVNRK